MCNGSGVGPVVHHEHLKLTGVIDDDRFEAIRVDIACPFVTSVPNTGHGNCTLESSTDAAVDTFGLSP